MSQPTHPTPRGDQDPIILENASDPEAQAFEVVEEEEDEFEEDDDEVNLVAWEASDDDEGWDT